MPPRIAYLTNRYPSVSHTFIRREIEAVERAGFEVDRFAVRPSPHGHVDAADAREAERTRYLLGGSKANLVLEALGEMARASGRLPTAVRAAAGMALRSKRGAMRHLAYLLEAARLRRWCRERGVAHVHAHFGTNPAAVARLARLLGGPTYSFTIHGPEEWDDPAGLDLAGKAADAAFVACISHFTAAQLRRWTPPEQWSKTLVVRCGIDGSFLDDPPPPDPQSRTFVCVGRLTAQKGQLLLLRAFADVAADWPEARLVLAGDGEMRPEVERSIRELGLEDRVEITGWIDSAEVRRRLAGARALVLASFAEGLPVVLMEAMALGRPVITTPIAGIPELVEHGVSGWLVPAGDEAAAAAAMRACLSADASTLARMGEAGRAAAARKHAIDAAAAPLVAQLQRVTGQRPARAPEHRLAPAAVASGA